MKGFSSKSLHLGAFFVLLALSSCIQENPLLVSPPPKYETVKVRFMNLSSDKNIKTLSLDNVSELSGVSYGSISQSIQPPSDSVTLFIKSGANVEFKYTQLIRFLRNTNYTFVGLTSLRCPSQNCGIDTIIMLRTTLAVDPNSKSAYVKFFNAFPDSLASYSLHLGCQNGEALSSGTRYLGYSFQPFLVPSGKTAVSIVKNTPTGGDQLVNLYELDLNPRGQYTIIVSRDPAGNEETLLLNEDEQSVTALTAIPTVEERSTEIRLINLSGFNASAVTSAGSVIAADQTPSSIGTYTKVTACSGSANDTLSLFSGGNLKNSVPAQLVVLEKYSFIAFDSTGNSDLRGIFVKPISKEILQSGKSYIRVVHSSLSAGPLTVSLGARYKAPSGSDTARYESGLVLASPINFGEISNTQILNPGQLPLTIFTASGSARLKFTGLAIVEPDKSYIMVITDGSQGEVEISLIDDDAQNETIQYVRHGSFVQFINAIPNDSYIRLSGTTNFGMLLQDARIYYTGSIGTVMEAGDNSITVNDKAYNFNCPENQRIMIVAAGSANAPDLFENLFDPYSSDLTYRLRFINALTDVNLADVRQNDSTGNILESVYYKGFSTFQNIDRSSKVTYYFSNNNGGANLFRISDISLSLGKSYNIILSGNASYGYSTILQQDY